MKKQLIAPLVAACLASGMTYAAEIVRTPYADKTSNGGVAMLVSAGTTVFPSGAAGTKGSALEQVDEIIKTLDANLKAKGLSGIGAMMQHTVYLKDGAAEPIAILGKFHGAATAIAPSLKTHKSVGTIVRVPSFPNKDTLLMVDIVAGAPAKAGGADEFKRIGFTFGPPEISETIRKDDLVYLAGTEAMDFEKGNLPAKIDEQIEAIVGKLHNSFKKAGLSIDNMITHNLYVTKGTDPGRVIQKFHETIKKYAPNASKNPGAGGIFIVNGMAVPGFLLEMDAIAAAGKPESYKRVPLAEVTMDVVRSVEADGLVFLSSMPGVDFENKMATSKDVLEQVDIAVKNVQNSLKKSGLSYAHVVKHRVYLKQGAGDAAKVRARMVDAINKLVPGYKDKQAAETFIIVEALASDDRLFEIHATAARP